MERRIAAIQGSLGWATRPGVVLLLALLATVALHGEALRKPFFSDDYFFLEQVRDKSLSEAVASPDPLGNFLRPVSRQLYFWSLSRLGQETPVIFHAANLLLFAGSLFLLFLLARGLGGTLAAIVAVVCLAFHYSADVPLRWASGSQDLLALFFGTLTIVLHRSGRGAAAAAALLLGLLSKEAVALTVLICLVADHRSPEPWHRPLRRGLGLVAVTAAWAAWWLLTLGQRPATGHTLSFAPPDVLALLAHLVQVAAGLEFRTGGPAPGLWMAGPLLIAAVAAGLVWLAAEGNRRAGGHQDAVDAPAHAPPSLIRIGLVWTLAGALPLAVVMPIWSAYYFLYAMAGVGLLVAGLTPRLPSRWRHAPVAALALFSAHARALDEFSTARGAWTWQSHVNRHYLDRALGTTERYLAQLRRIHPTMPARTTVFFADLPASVGWQAGDGPLLRWAYRDTSLRSYLMNQFSIERARRGPVLFFVASGDSLRDLTGDPMILPSFAYGMILSGRPEAAVDALTLAIARVPSDRDLTYWRAWARLGAGDSIGALSDLRAAGIEPASRLGRGEDAFAAGGVADTAARVSQLVALRARAGLHPQVHARLAALWLASPAHRKDGAIEAYAFRILAPDDPDAWRKLASAQLAEGLHEPALRSLETYVRIGGSAAAEDREVRQVIHSLRRVVHGDIASQELHASRQP